MGNGRANGPRMNTIVIKHTFVFFRQHTIVALGVIRNDDKTKLLKIQGAGLDLIGVCLTDYMRDIMEKSRMYEMECASK